MLSCVFIEYHFTNSFADIAIEVEIEIDMKIE
jgi:hypothetical protein